MRSRLATRSTRLVLAAAAVTALAATTTACDPDDVTATSPSADATVASPTTEAPGDSGSGGSSDEATTAPDAAKDDQNGSSDDATTDTDAAKSNGYGQSCGSSDLTFTLSSKDQKGGYLLITAKAKSGITCYLEGTYADAQFGSDTDAVAVPEAQSVTGTIKVSGSTVAYIGINPKTTNTNDGKEFSTLSLGILDDTNDPAGLDVPAGILVDKPSITNWTADAAAAVPAG